MRSYGALEVLGLGLRVLEGFMELYELLWVLATPIIIVTMTRMMIIAVMTIAFPINMLMGCGFGVCASKT